MTFKEYQEQAKRTCPTLGSEKLDLAHMVLGIHSEYNEWINATDSVNESEELADMLWYLANYCTFRGYNFERLFDVEIENTSSVTFNSSKLQDLVKKYIAYNKPINISAESILLENLAYTIRRMYNDTSIYQSLQNNIDKLRIRCPEKFDEELAKNRDLVSERKELERSEEHTSELQSP